MQPGTTTELLHDEADVCRRFGSVVPLAVPEPVAIIDADQSTGYPGPWSLYRWIDGESLMSATLPDEARLARDLAVVIRAIRTVDPQGRTWSGEGRGGPMATGDEMLAHYGPAGAHLIDLPHVQSVWRQCRAAAPAPCETWVHGDPMPGNLLVRDDRLAAVIDWGGATVADPAVDLQPAWNLLSATGRAVLRDELGCDDDEWARGRGWALLQAIGCLGYYEHTNPPMSRLAHRTLTEILAG